MDGADTLETNMATDRPYAWKSARSRNGLNSTVEEMAEKGRKPSLDSAGNIRGFRSRPGATVSSRESMANLGIPGNPEGGLSDSTAWGSFFKGNSPTGVRLGFRATNPAIAAAANPLAATSAPTPNPAAPMGNTDADWRLVPGLYPESEPDGSVPGFPGLASSTPNRAGYLDNVINTAQNFLRRNRGALFQDDGGASI